MFKMNIFSLDSLIEAMIESEFDLSFSCSREKCCVPSHWGISGGPVGEDEQVQVQWRGSRS